MKKNETAQNSADKKKDGKFIAEMQNYDIADWKCDCKQLVGIVDDFLTSRLMSLLDDNLYDCNLRKQLVKMLDEIEFRLYGDK